MNVHAGYSITHNSNRCKTCLECVAICPFNAITVSDGKWEYNQDICAGCGLCVEHCPNNALELIIDESKPKPLDIAQLL